MLSSLWESFASDSESSHTVKLKNRARTEKARSQALLNKQKRKLQGVEPTREADIDPRATKLQSTFFASHAASKTTYRTTDSRHVDFRMFAKDRSRACWSYLSAFARKLAAFFSGPPKYFGNLAFIICIFSICLVCSSHS